MRRKTCRNKNHALGFCRFLMKESKSWEHAFRMIEEIAHGVYSEDGSPDVDAQISLLKELANMGCYEAMNRLGVIYLDAKGVEQDVDLGVEWLEKAAVGNDINAIENLAYIYLLGEERHLNHHKGLDYCIHALNERGDDILLTLANCYDKGAGVEKNLNYSFYLFQLAVAEGNGYSREEAEHELTLFKSDYIKPLKYIDFYPKAKYGNGWFSPKDMKKAVYDNIDFNLPSMCWFIINRAFSSCWNMYLGENINYENLLSEIKGRLQNSGLENVVSDENLQKVFDVMIDFARCTDGIILEDKEEIFWDFDMDLIEYPSDAQLVTVITYASDNVKENYYNDVISQLISHAKRSAVVWCRKTGIEPFSGDISYRLFGDIDYLKHFSLTSTDKDGIFLLSCKEKDEQVADLYLIADDNMTVFDFCTKAQVCKESFGTNYVFVDDIDYMELPSELMLLKKSRVLDLSIATLKVLALSLNIPVVVQKSMTARRGLFVDKPTVKNSVPFCQHIEPMSDRIVIAYYDNIGEKNIRHLHVVKDNKNSTGKVTMAIKRNYYG